MFDDKVIELATGFDKDGDNAFMSDLMGYFSQHVKDIAPWWSRTRDAELRGFWKDGESTSIVMGLAQNRLASIPVLVVPRDMSVAAHVRHAQALNERLLINSEFGLGLHHAMLKFTEDYLGQDNGAFMEIIGEGSPTGPIEGPVLALRHLDAAHCKRTSDPVYPVVYVGNDSKEYKIHNARIIFMSQMPSASRKMNNVGFSSVSRSLRIAQNAHHVLNYQDEKMGARAASQILVGSGITGKEIIKAIAASSHMMDNLGLENLAKTVALGSTTGDIDLKRVELNNFDPFDEEVTKTFSAYAFAAAWGLEFQDLIPVSGNKSSEIVSLQRARGRLPQAFMTSFLQQANTKIVPRHLEVKMDFIDDQADQQHAVIEDITSRNHERQISAGVTTPEIVQQTMLERGYISRNQFRSAQLSRGTLENGIPVQSLFFNKLYDDMLLVPRELLQTSANDADEALAAIEANEVFIYAIIGSTGSGIVHNKAEESLRALKWLRDKYESFIPEELEEEPEEEEEEEEEDNGPQDGRLTNQDAGMPAKEAVNSGVFNMSDWFRVNLGIGNKDG